MLINISSMKIYFAGAIRGGRDDAKLYKKIIAYLENMGQVLTEHVGNQDLCNMGEKGGIDTAIYKRDMEWLESSHCVVAEVSAPSHGAGFEISYALFVMNIPVLIFHSRKGKRLSAMLQGCDLPNITVIHYSDFGEIEVRLREFLHRVSKKKRTESL